MSAGSTPARAATHAHGGALEALLGEELPCRDQQGLATVRPRRVGAALRGRLRVRRRDGAHDAWPGQHQHPLLDGGRHRRQLGGEPGRVQCSRAARPAVVSATRTDAAVKDDRRPGGV